MTLTEPGLHFRRENDRWRCVEWQGLVTGVRYEMDGQRLDSLGEAVRWAIQRA